MSPPPEHLVQGKPVARRGRKARDLPPEDRPVAEIQVKPPSRGETREGEPGALHLGRGDARLDGPDGRRWNAVELIMEPTAQQRWQ
jgi:hypothetical protein